MLNIRLKFKQILSTRFFRQCCQLCADHDGGELSLCDACCKSLPWHTVQQCPQCGLPTPDTDIICGGCLSSPPHFDATHALFSYDFPVDSLLQHYKYKSHLHLAHTFASLLLHKITSANSKPVDLIIPMPMHSARLKERGFNQALELARILSEELQLNLDYTTCLRNKLTPPQASLPLKQRIKNINGVFHCTKNLRGLSIAVVDDVMTTGASLNELAKTLKQAGAAHVECWVIARTLPRPFN